MAQNLKQKFQSNFLSLQWQTWIADNLARGCTVDSMVDVMVQQKFDRTTAAMYIQQHSDRATGSLATNSAQGLNTTAFIGQPSSYGYETPRLKPLGSVITTPDREVRVSLRMAQPVIAVLDNMLSEQECDELVRLASIKLKRSTIVDPATGREEVIQERSSHGTFFTLTENDFIKRLERRISAVMNLPIENGEGLQILNYKVGGEYKPHFDYFPPGEAGSAVHLAKGGQRVSTLIMYLNNVEQAGETSFPDLGLSITPKKGTALYFEYCNSLDQVDPLTLHAGMPVVAGEKWIATKWMRQRKYG